MTSPAKIQLSERLDLHAGLVADLQARLEASFARVEVLLPADADLSARLEPSLAGYRLELIAGPACDRRSCGTISVDGVGADPSTAVADGLRRLERTLERRARRSRDERSAA